MPRVVGEDMGLIVISWSADKSPRSDTERTLKAPCSATDPFPGSSRRGRPVFPGRRPAIGDEALEEDSETDVSVLKLSSSSLDELTSIFGVAPHLSPFSFLRSTELRCIAFATVLTTVCEAIPIGLSGAASAANDDSLLPEARLSTS
eukprot:scaffold3941_cov412-Prasinococcus_capsulatus_cf.AAC.2